MFNIKSIAGALVVGLAIGGWLGHGMASGACAKRELDVALSYAEGWKSALEAANRDAAAERKRAVSAAASRGRASALSQEVIHESAADPDRACEWDDAQRLRIARIYAAYGYRTFGTNGVYGTLPGPGADSAASKGMGGRDDSANAGVQTSAR